MPTENQELGWPQYMSPTGLLLNPMECDFYRRSQRTRLLSDEAEGGDDAKSDRDIGEIKNRPPADLDEVDNSTVPKPFIKIAPRTADGGADADLGHGMAKDKSCLREPEESGNEEKPRC